MFNSQNRASGAYRSNHNNICKQKTPFSENPKMSKSKRKRAEMKPQENMKETWRERERERERENQFSSTKTYRILSSPQTCAGRRNMKTGTNYNRHEGLGKEKYIPRHVDNRRLLNAAIRASVFARGGEMRSEVVERRTKRRRNTHTHTTHTSDTVCLTHTKTRLLAVDEICTQDHTLCCG